MDNGELQGPETVEEAINLLRNDKALGSIYELCVKAETEGVPEMQIPRNIVTALVLCTMALWVNTRRAHLTVVK